MITIGKSSGGGINEKFGFKIYLSLWKTDNQQYILYNTGNFTQHFIITYKRKESQKYVYMHKLLFH